MSTSATKPTLGKPIVDTEEDLDDLDDVLSEFGTGKQSVASPPPPPPPTAATSGSSTTTFTLGGGTKGRLRTNTRVDAPPESIPGPIKKPKTTTQLDSTTEEGEGDDESDDVLSSEDFARELAREMENLVREIAGDSSPASAPGAAGEGSTSGSSGDGAPKAKDEKEEEEERARAFKAAWEAMLVEGMNANLGLGEDGLPVPVDPSAQNAAAGSSSGSGSGTGAPGGTGASFQDKIKQTMGKLKESESKLKSPQGPSPLGGFPPPDADSLQELLKSLGDLGLGEGDGEGGAGGEGGEGSEELAGFLESMMGQLMSKDVLYEPLKELADNFPPYLENPPSPLSSEDRSRYTSQLTCVRKILTVFEKEGYSDANAEYSRQVVDLMSEMQSYGTPPPEIMGPLPPGFDGTNPLLGAGADENCTIA